MRYPRSINARSAFGAPLSAPSWPVSATGPNRPSPADISLINAAEAATQLRKDAKVRRDRDYANAKLRPSRPFGRRKPLWPRKLPVGPRLPWFTIGKGLWYMLHTPPTPWELYDTVGSWRLVRICVPPPLDSTPEMVSHTVLGQTAAGPALNTCYVNQAGFWDGVTINPGPPWAMTADTSRTRNRLAIQFVGALNLANRVHSRYHWWRMHEFENASPFPYGGWTGPSPLLPQPAHDKVPASQKPVPLPEPENAPWLGGYYPDVYPPGTVPFETAPPPIWHRPERPTPWSPQAPDVGYETQPQTNPAPAPLPGPGTFTPVLPVPPELEEAFPDIAWEPAPVTGTTTISTNGAVRRDPPVNPPVTAAGAGEKQTKVRLGGVMGFLYHALSPITEGVDAIEVVYECLPKSSKIDAYKKRGRQPNPAEKLEIIYSNINNLNAGCVVTGLIENQLEDMLYALGGQQLAAANRKDNRPIGYSAGGGLTGGGEYVGIIPR